jgi:hypothetical protein
MYILYSIDGQMKGVQSRVDETLDLARRAHVAEFLNQAKATGFSKCWHCNLAHVFEVLRIENYEPNATHNTPTVVHAHVENVAVTCSHYSDKGNYRNLYRRDLYIVAAIN